MTADLVPYAADALNVDPADIYRVTKAAKVPTRPKRASQAGNPPETEKPVKVVLNTGQTYFLPLPAALNVDPADGGLSSLTKAQLVELAKSLELPVGGNKSALIERIEAKQAETAADTEGDDADQGDPPDED